MNEQAEVGGRRRVLWKVSLGLAALALLLAGLGRWSIQLPTDPNRLAVGQQAPSTEALLDVEGKPFRLESLSGLPVLVFYRGHW